MGTFAERHFCKKLSTHMVVRGRRIYAVSANEIHVIDAATGTTNHMQDTGVSDDYERPIHRNSIHIQGG
jgi:hypothetical protein